MPQILPNEKELLIRAAEGDREAFGELYSKYYSPIFSSIDFITKSSSQSEDIIQEAFVRVWISRDALLLVRSFGDYVFTIARNILFDRMRREKSKSKVENEYMNARETQGMPVPDDILLYKQYYNTALNALQELTDQKREIFLLRTQHNLTLNEIAEHTGLSRSSIKKHLYGTFLYLKNALKTQADWVVVLLVLFNY